jgi:hypothetical protein
MKTFSMLLTAMALCWPGAVFSKSDDDPFGESPQKPAARKMSSETQPATEKANSAAAIVNGDDQEPPLLVRVYDVRDILLAVPSAYPASKSSDLDNSQPLFPFDEGTFYPFQGSMGMGGMRSGNDPAPSSLANKVPNTFDSAAQDVTAINELSDLIKRVFSPAMWVSSGGEWEISHYGDLMVVSTTENVHEQVQILLGQIRKHLASRKTVTVETHWLWLTEEQLLTLAPNSGGLVEEEAWDAHQKRLASEDSELTPGYHALISCLNGQTVSTLAGRQRRFMVSLIPVVGDEGISQNPAPATPACFGGGNNRAVGYQPQSSTIQEGAALQVRPILCGDEEVLLDIHGRVVEVETPDQPQVSPPDHFANTAPKQPGANYGSDIRDLATAVDRPVVNNSRIDTTIRLPLNSRVLVGGITGSTPNSPDEPNLYLFAKVTVQKASKDTDKNK